MSAEEIQLENTAESLAVSGLPSRVPDSAARYHLYRFDHNYEGDFYHSVCEYLVIAFCKWILGNDTDHLYLCQLFLLFIIW